VLLPMFCCIMRLQGPSPKLRSGKHDKIEKPLALARETVMKLAP
jgi:hypothetical protein